jgi:hypothetical protein
MRIQLITGADVGARVDASEEVDGPYIVQVGGDTGGVEGVSWTECSVPAVVARSRLHMWKNELRTYPRAACPQGSILHRGQKCLYRCLRGRGRYHHSASSARTDRPVSGS